LLITNFILFQLAWFAGVLGAANSLPWLGVSATAIKQMENIGSRLV
jgi:hypothetical protein